MSSSENVGTRVPPSVSTQIELFCKGVVQDTKPIFVSISPVEGAILNECFPNVDMAIGQGGGSRLLGWKIMEWPGVLLEAEFHAVWVQPNGDLLDVSPEPLGWDRNLFLPDPVRTYDGRQVDNIRHALSPLPAVSQLIEFSEKFFQETNKGDLAGYHGPLVLTDEAALLFERRRILLSVLKGQGVSDFQIKGLIERNGIGGNQKCPCGSGAKIKHCHGG